MIELTITEDMARDAGLAVRALLEETIARTGRCRLGLSGGGTPQGLYAWLGENLGPEIHEALWVTWVDERLVPVSGPGWRGQGEASNARMAFERWLAEAPIPDAQILMMHEGGAPEAEGARFEARFAQDFGGALDGVILGAGPDGHIASWFPGRAEPLGGCVSVVEDSPKPPPVRMTLTRRVLERVRWSVLLAGGAAKGEVLGQAYRGEAGTPLAAYRPDGRYLWYVDEAAAAAGRLK